MEAVELALERHLDINPETGEIEGEERPLVIKELPLIARQMRALNSRIEAIKVFRDQEAERIMSVCTDKMIRLEKQVIYFEYLAEQMVKEMPEQKIEYPGIGRFRFRKMPDKIDTTTYDQMTDEEKLHVQNHYKGCFNRKVSITPDKKAIKALLTDIAEGRSEALLTSFQIKAGGKKFEFVPEKEM